MKINWPKIYMQCDKNDMQQKQTSWTLMNFWRLLIIKTEQVMLIIFPLGYIYKIKIIKIIKKKNQLFLRG